MNLTIMTAVSGRLERFRRHLAALAACVGVERAEYCLGIWGEPSEHLAVLEEYEGVFGEVRVYRIPDDKYFPLPVAYNVLLSHAACDRLAIVGADMLVPPEYVEWAAGLDDDAGWCPDAIEQATGRVLIGATQPGAWPYAMAIAKKDIEAIGGWDEGFADGVVYDDTDLALRLIANGTIFRWNHDILTVHQSHERYDNKNRHGEPRKRNKDRLIRKLNGITINNIWPAFWRHLITQQPRMFQPGDNERAQKKLQALLRQHKYPIVAGRPK